MSATPQTIENDLFKKVVLLLNSTVKPDIFSINAIKHSAEQLMKIDPPRATSALAVVDMFNGKFDDMRTKLNSALSMAIQTRDAQYYAVILNDYAVALTNTGYWDECNNLLQDALEHNPESHFIVNKLINSLIHTGRYHDAIQYTQQYPQVVDEQVAGEWTTSELHDITLVLDAAEITDNQVVEYYNIVSQLIRDQGIFNRGFRESACDGQIIRDFLIGGTEEDSIQFNDLLVDAILDANIPISIRNILIVGFMPASILEEAKLAS